MNVANVVSIKAAHFTALFIIKRREENNKNFFFKEEVVKMES
jgi:hypothetical protein